MIGKRRSERSGRQFEIVMRDCRREMKHGAGSWQSGVGSRKKAVGSRGFARIAVLLVLTLITIAYSRTPLFAQTRTTVSDTLHGPDGSLPSGKIVITSKSTFTASDGTVVFSGAVATATVTNGAFTVSLIPNAGSTPSGTSYSAIYKLAGVPYREETWVVPASATPVGLSVVRSTILSGPSAMVSASQMPALSGDVNSSAGSASASVVGLHWGSSGYTLSGAPSDGQCLTVSGFTITGGACGSGQPAGSSGQVQMNNGGAFAGAADLTYDTASGATTLIARDKGGEVFNVKAYGAVGDGVTDDTAAVNAAFAAAYAAGGGVIYFPSGKYLIAGALTVPNDGAANPKQPPYRIKGASMDGNSSGWGGDPANGSILLMTETTDAAGKIDTRGGGYMEIDHLSFQDTASDSVPFIFSTNTILHVHDCSFTSSQSGTANVQDAIILGGSNPADIHTGNVDAPFQGYGTVIRDNYFNRVRHAVVGNTYANGVQIVTNTVGPDSGSSTAGDAPFVFVGYGSGSQGTTGGYINGNLIEMKNYYYGVRLDQYAEDFTMLGNSAYDGGANSTATYYLGTGSDTEVLSCGQVASTYCVDPTAPGATQYRYVAFSQLADSNGSGVMLGDFPTLIKGALVANGQCFSFGSTTNMCMYASGANLFIRPQYNNSLRFGIDSAGDVGVKSPPGPPYNAALDVNGDIRTAPVAFASAPACSSTNEGSMQAISDSSTATWGAAITGGGTNHVLGYCDGTSWTVAGK